jgi:hypothetical protein
LTHRFGGFNSKDVIPKVGQGVGLEDAPDPEAKLRGVLRLRPARGPDGLYPERGGAPGVVLRLVQYSNVSRGKRRKAQGEEPIPIAEFTEVSASAAKRAWARLIKQV